MRHLITTGFLFFCLSLSGQNDNPGIFIPKDDASPIFTEIRHMWVGLKNPIAEIGPAEIIKVWTDNGTADSCRYYMVDFCVTPLKIGSVNVFSIQRIWNGKKYDTVSTKNSFIAIKPPTIKLEILKDNFRIDSTIEFRLIDKKTKKPMGKRYEVGVMYEPEIYDQKDSLIGKVHLCFGTKIYFNQERMQKLKVKINYKIKIRVLVRDMETDLLISVEELVYKLK